MSVLSYPERGHWGKASWHGNASGYLYADLFKMLMPRVFVDPMVGSRTSVEVAQEMGIEAYGLDLHSGFNILRDRIIEAVKKEADLVVSHPPYGGQVLYSAGVWGDEAHPDDLSRCESDEDFHEKLQFALLNQREATKAGGHYGVLIGDWRRQGRYTSYQAEVIARMPADELAGILIKQQHNTRSSRKQYGKMLLPFITHEYLVLWKKKETALFLLLNTLHSEQRARSKGTWRSILRMVLLQKDGAVSPLDDIYNDVLQAAPDRIKSNPEHWKAAIRRTLQESNDFVSNKRGVWALAA